jgi:hypothetical protein
MSYTPLNVQTFVAAMSGSLSGIGIGERPITSTNPNDYNGLALAAFAYAQEFDTQWGVSAPDEYEWGAILSASEGYWNSRDKESHKPTDYTSECAAIIAAIREGDAVLIAEGISIPAWPPGGGGPIVTAVTGVAPIASSGGTTPAISLNASGVAPGTVGDATHVAQVTVDAQGIITSIASVPIVSAGVGTVTDVTGTAPIVITGSPTATPNVTITPATDSAPGSLSAADKTKLDGLTGQVVVSGTAPIVITGSALAPDVTITPATELAAGSLSAADKTKIDNITTIVTAVAVTAPIQNTGSSTAPNIGLANSGTPVGTFGDGTHTAQVTVDAHGIVTDVVAVPITTAGVGTVTDVTGTAPIVITGSPTATPNVTITPATDSAPGSLSAADKTKIDNITTIVTAVAVTAPIVNTGSSTAPNIGLAVGEPVGTFGDATHVAQVTTDANGLVTSITNVAITATGTVTNVTGTAPVSVAAGTTAPVVSLTMADNTLLIGQVGGGSPAAHAMSGDAALSDTGVLTFDTVNPDVGTFGDATHVARITVNAKGLVTAVVSTAITATGTVTDVTASFPIAITGSPTATPNVTHSVSGVAAGSYGNSVNEFLAIDVDTYGHITDIGNVALQAPARAYVANQGAAIALTGALVVGGSLTITPKLTGKIRCEISGFLESTDSTGTAHPFTIAVGDAGAGLRYAQATMPRTNQNIGGVNGVTPFSLVVDLDSIGSSSVTYPVGTPVTLEALVLGDASGDLSIPINGLQFAVQEQFA